MRIHEGPSDLKIGMPLQRMLCAAWRHAPVVTAPFIVNGKVSVRTKCLCGHKDLDGESNDIAA